MSLKLQKSPQSVNTYFLGGMGSLRKHVFMGQALREGPVAPSPISSEQNTRISMAIESFMGGVLEEVDKLFNEVERAFDYATEDFGEFDSRAETLGQAYEDVRAIRTKVEDFITGAAAPYVNDEVKNRVVEIDQKIDDLDNLIQTSPFPARAPLTSRLSEDHTQEHIAVLDELAREAEKRIVEVESSDVAVREPMESDTGLMPIIGLGVIAAAAYGIYEFFFAD